MFRLPFAAGNVFSASMLDTLLYQVCEVPLTVVLRSYKLKATTLIKNCLLHSSLICVIGVRQGIPHHVCAASSRNWSSCRLRTFVLRKLLFEFMIFAAKKQLENHRLDSILKCHLYECTCRCKLRRRSCGFERMVVCISVCARQPVRFPSPSTARLVTSRAAPTPKRWVQTSPAISSSF